MALEQTPSPITSTAALARHLGLSRWTISRVLNGHPEVKPETSHRVREAMKELGFVPNLHGRALRGARTAMVGVCFQAIGSPIVARKIAVLQQVLRRANLRGLFEVTDGNPKLEVEVAGDFVAMGVDGIICVGGFTRKNGSRIVRQLQERNIPLVLVDPMNELPVPSVELNRESGMRLAVEHLFDLGHRRFGLLGIDEDVAYGLNRWRGLRLVAADRGLSMSEDFVSLSEPSPPALDFAYGRRLAERFLKIDPSPTAILALNDQTAVGAMACFLEAGVRIPGELSIVGFDNIDVAAHVNPRLTTIDQDVEQVMRCALALLQQQASRGGRPAWCHRLVEPVFVHGRSTGPVLG